MTSNTWKFYYVMALFLVVAWLCNKIHPASKRDEVVLGGSPISREPCLSVVGDLFGKAVDSNKACDCLLPGYYELVKNDTEELSKFNYSGIHMLPGARNEQVNALFARCIGKHIIDSAYKMHLTPPYATRFRQLLADRIRTDTLYQGLDADSVAQCLVDRFNDHITVAEYLGLTTWTDSTVKVVFTPCIIRRPIHQ
ncbi:MAG: hypothetical protein ABUL46_00400 [Chitinophaga rupis]